MPQDPLSPDLADWRERLDVIVETMREMSRHTDPQEMVRAYARRMQHLVPRHRRLSLSRRDLLQPEYRITRSTTWTEEINPWKEKHRLPLFRGGTLADLIYNAEPRIIDDFAPAKDDPAFEYLDGHRSLLAIPMYDQGESLNMVVLLSENAGAFVPEQLPDLVWRSNLFGRATGNLVLRDELHNAYQALDRELKIVGDIQRALLPAELPKIPTLDVAAHYQPARRAGGDYYDFFPLPDGQWGIFIGDVSGHGTPAAVLMAVTHCIAHTHPGPARPPAQVLAYLNHHLATRYASLSETFVTAFYAIYDPATRRLTYSSAGHNPPRLKSCRDGSLVSLDGAAAIPLGIRANQQYTETSYQLAPGDQLVLYTDGITETRNSNDELFGTSRLDDTLEMCGRQAQGLLESILQAVEEFAAGRAADDDRTIIVGRVT
ncbi:MAG: PP2C family protein-serine/threonine phosphatase [Planctomycetaceae bacterium]